MDPRQRMLKAFRRETPDHVPCVPDLFEMVPIRLSGRPSWESLLYNDPPIWKLRADAAFHYGVDAFVIIGLPFDEQTHWAIIDRTDERVIARILTETEQGPIWSREAYVMARNDASSVVLCETIGLPAIPQRFEKVVQNDRRTGKVYFDAVRNYIGERGIVAPCLSLPALPHWEADMMEFYQDPETVMVRKQADGEAMMRLAETFLSWQPDLIMIGNSGLMLFNPPNIFREVCLPWLKKVTALAKQHGVLTHMHCCGPERYLVETAANETDLDAIEPLEIAPMGDCNLRELKQQFGHRLCLKGNLHTTEIMLRSTPEQVEDACKKAIDDAAAGGGFILATGDQTPRDVKDETIATMRRVAETYGRY